MSDYPRMIASVDHIEPVPRRIRATLAGRTVLDTTQALYLWEWENYPQYYIPLADVNQDFLVDEDHEAKALRGTTKVYGLRAGDVSKRSAARLFTASHIDAIVGHLRFEWQTSTVGSKRTKRFTSILAILSFAWMHCDPRVTCESN
jgi:uncharacterized protein (DUF427 family)